MALILRGKTYHTRFMVNGVLVAKSTKCTNKREAERVEAKWKGEVFTEVVIKQRKPITVEKATAAFQKVRIGTIGHESCEIKMRPWVAAFKDRMLHEVSGEEVLTEARRPINEDGYSVNTINVSIIYWNSLQNYCSKAGFTPGEKIKQLKGGGGRIRFLNEDEVRKLLAALDPNNGHYRYKRMAQDNLDFTIMLLETGAREREVAELQLSQINQEAGTITIHRSKGGTDTTFRLSKAMLEVIARRQVAAETPCPGIHEFHSCLGNGFLFPARANGRYNNEFITKAAKLAGLRDVTCHTLRHTFACRMLQAGVSLTEVQHFLGHKNLTSTMCYLHVVPTAAADRAAEVLNAGYEAQRAAAVSATPVLRLVG